MNFDMVPGLEIVNFTEYCKHILQSLWKPRMILRNSRTGCLFVEDGF